jgi:hypothetical protein
VRGQRRTRALLAALIALSLGASGASATVIQDGTLRITLLAQIAPVKLPRTHTAPISVFVAGHVASTTGAIPPQLQRMDIKVNRHGLLQSVGLPVCRIDQIQTATTRKALTLCAPALIGAGRFWAHIVLPGQPPYPTHGRLLIFNGREGKKQLILAHIYTSSPLPSAFVIAFAIRHIHQNPYGTELSATLPQALGSWGYVDRIKLNLGREYSYKGQSLSYFNAACPAPKGTNRAAFPLALASFYFEGRRPLRATEEKACGVRE